jgi:hypothetical protein
VADTCPHCGAVVGSVSYAFCSECREPLDEAPRKSVSSQAAVLADERPGVLEPIRGPLEGQELKELVRQFGRDTFQLVGSRCCFCEKMMGSSADGEFCSACHTPYHHECRFAAASPIKPSQCAACASDLSHLLAARAEQERSAVAAKQRGRASGELTAVDWVICVLLPVIGLIAGIIRAVQGKPSGAKMLVASIGFLALWTFMRFALVACL